MQKPIISEEGDKSMLTVKRKLRELGVNLQHTSPQDRKANQERLLKISVWTEEDLKMIEDTRQSFGAIKPAEW
ncbi:hypothetical protein [Pedobacter sp. V48]|uniref:hypothetical protein n=1 Tax=Pedobacter sp. V48 TaxID=509635 RepID=UPI0003E4B0DD|nr:hypothetical protein [Pedobacter sp. V48]ETZ22853.1 hypothetical protein N824_21425 [Pedobacter sp. V48]